MTTNITRHSKILDSDWSILIAEKNHISSVVSTKSFQFIQYFFAAMQKNSAQIDIFFIINHLWLEVKYASL